MPSLPAIALARASTPSARPPARLRSRGEAGWKRGLVAVALIGSVFSAAALSAQPEVLDLAEAAQLLRLSPQQVERLARGGQLPGRDVGGQWRFSRSALLAWLGGAGPAASSSALEVDELARTTGRQQPAGARAGTVGEQPASPSAEAIALRDQGGLLRRGSGTVEFGISHARSEQSLFPVVRDETSTTTATGVLRFVPIDGLQVAARLPYTWQTGRRFVDTTSLAGPAEIVTRDEGRGDASYSLLAQLLRERGGVPNLLISLDGTVASDRERSDGLGTSLLLTKSADPAVLFAGLSYLRALDSARVDERNGLARQNFAFNLGFTYALNDLVALNTVFGGTYRNYRTEAAGALAGSLPPSRESYALQFGATWLLARGLFVEPSVAVRIGGDRPDMTFSLSLPWTF